MPECSYCEASFDDEESLLRHMGEAHQGELGTIDQRRVADLTAADDGGLPTGPIVLVGVIVIALAMVAYVIVFAGGGNAGGDGEPGSLGSAHEHGTMEMQVLGERVDFSRPEYQGAADRFHFEPVNGQPNGEIWHTHAQGVTIQWAMETLDINVTADSVTYDGTTYRDSDPDYDVTVTVDGEPVDPSSHALEGVGSLDQVERGDSVRILVERADESN